MKKHSLKKYIFIIILSTLLIILLKVNLQNTNLKYLNNQYNFSFEYSKLQQYEEMKSPLYRPEDGNFSVGVLHEELFGLNIEKNGSCQEHNPNKSSYTAPYPYASWVQEKKLSKIKIAGENSIYYSGKDDNGLFYWACFTKDNFSYTFITKIYYNGKFNQTNYLQDKIRGKKFFQTVIKSFRFIE